MKIFLLIFILATAVQAQDEFYYFDDYRLNKNNLTTEMATGYYTYSSRPWPGGVVPVQFDRTISSDYRARFMSACEVWSEVANVQCRLRSTRDTNYLFVTDRKERCWTDVGSKTGKQEFNFAFEWCWERTSLIHELGHVLGFMHEHQRPDRDKYLKVYPQHAGDMAYSYAKLSFGPLDKKSAYDFMSIMHYWNKAYSVNGKAIMVPRSGYEKYTNTMGTSKNLTRGDIELVRRVYGPKVRQ